MKFRICLLILILTVVFAEANAQSKKDKKKKKADKVQVDPLKGNDNSLFPNKPESNSQSKKRSGKKNQSFAEMYKKNLDAKVKEARERQKQNAKRDKKIEKKMDHPMYSDFSYFGHKKKPKIRPVGKKKFCKECGISH